MVSKKKSKKQKGAVNSKKNKFGGKYYDISEPGSYSGLSGFVKNNKNMKNMKTVKSWSMKQYVITRHKPGCLNFKRHKTIVGGVDNQWQ